MGAWIETSVRAFQEDILASHSSWVRGLKPYEDVKVKFDEVSHSSWVRGLKLLAANGQKAIARSHSSWVRGLKQKSDDCTR